MRHTIGPDVLLIMFMLLCATGMAWLVIHATGRNRNEGDELIHPNWDGHPRR